MYIYEVRVRGMNDSGELGSCNYTFLFCSNKHYIKKCGVHSDVCFLKYTIMDCLEGRHQKLSGLSDLIVCDVSL